MLKEMNHLQFGEFTVDRRAREIRRGEAVLPVSGKAFDLLVYMVENPGRPLLKSELLEAVWPETSVEESNLSQNVFLLRKVLGSAGPIKTLAGRGYQFATPVKELVAAGPHGVDTMPSGSSISALTLETTSTRMVMEDEVEERLFWRLPRRKSLLYVALSTAVILIAFLGWRALQRGQDRAGGPPLTVVLSAMDGTTGDAVLDRALVDALRMDLAQSPWISVVPDSTVKARLTEMGHKTDEVMTMATAREVCERANSQAVLSGSLARIGRHYLVTEEASNCVDGSLIGQSKYEAATEEELPHAIDELASTLRGKLGESRRSIARFNMPLFAQNTPSLDALKALTQGVEADRSGESIRATAFYKLAISADPNFAWAYYSLAIGSYNAGDFAASRAASAKAYSLRETAGKPQAFAITALYNVLVTQDLYESLRNYQAWVSLYPNSPLAWNGLAFVQAELGRYADAAASDRHSVALAPQNENFQSTLALSLIQSGEVDAARKTLDQAVAMKIDDHFIRVRYLELAYLLHDQSLLREQSQWSDLHPRTEIVLLTEAEIAIAEGRFADARRLIANANRFYHEEGAEGAADQYTKSEAVEMMEAGDASQGKSLFLQSPANLEEGEQVFGLALSGSLSAAQSAVRAMQTKYPKGTLWQLYWGPLTQAVCALQGNKPKEAVAVLESARPLENRELVVRWLRGNAYLASGQPAIAELDYRTVVTHPQWDPTSPTISLSWLGLGRALAAENKPSAARDAYQHFLTLWAHADPDALYLKQARKEFAALQASPAYVQ